MPSFKYSFKRTEGGPWIEVYSTTPPEAMATLCRRGRTSRRNHTLLTTINIGPQELTFMALQFPDTRIWDSWSGSFRTAPLVQQATLATVPVPNEE